MQTFGARLVACLDASGITQAELARRIGISGASVSDWTHDKTQASQVKAEPLLRAAAVLRVNPLWLLSGRGAKDDSSLPPHVAEPPAAYSDWPFHFIDREAISALRPAERSMLEGAWINTAQALGYKIAKRPP